MKYIIFIAFVLNMTSCKKDSHLPVNEPKGYVYLGWKSQGYDSVCVFKNGVQFSTLPNLYKHKFNNGDWLKITARSIPGNTHYFEIYMTEYGAPYKELRNKSIIIDSIQVSEPTY